MTVTLSGKADRDLLILAGIAVASIELVAFGTELVDLEPEPNEEDDPAESGEGRVPGRQSYPSMARPDAAPAISEGHL
jgi:hypothetical protein